MKKFMALFLTTIIIFANVSVVFAAGDDYKNSFSLTGSSAGGPVIDGNFDDWEGIPHSYEYNWDNSANCWYYGVWIDGVCYKTPVGTYDSNVRHKIALYCDGENVYLHIEFARDYYAKMNGDFYNFDFDGKRTTMRITYQGNSLANNAALSNPGVYQLEVRHGNGAVSGYVAEGSQAVVRVKPGNYNAELEVKIPLKAFAQQNPSIRLDQISVISWDNSGNLTYRPVMATGTSSGPVVLAGLSIGVAAVGFVLYDRRKRNGNI